MLLLSKDVTLLVVANTSSFLVTQQAPSERARLYFLLAWFHAIVQERLRYVPLGWSKRYEFSESDLRVACDTLDTWLDAVAQVRDSLLTVIDLGNANVTLSFSHARRAHPVSLC